MQVAGLPKAWWSSWRQRRKRARAYAAMHRVAAMAERADAEARAGIQRLVEQWRREDATPAYPINARRIGWWNEPTVANAPVLPRPYVDNSRRWWRA